MNARRLLLCVSVILVTLGLVVAPVAAADSERGQVVRFQGLIESRPDADPVGEWVVDGRAVQVVAETLLVETEGPAEVGARVMVVAEKQDDESLQAILIRVLPEAPPTREISVRGQATEVADDHIVVNRLTILITPATRITGEELVVGALVKVDAIVEGETITAVRINVLSHHRYVEFRGVVVSIGEDAWVIDDKTVAVDENTVIGGEPEVGDTVVVRAQVLEDDALLAVWIRALGPTPVPTEVTFTGVIQRFPPSLQGFWLISGRTVVVTSETVVNGEPAIGAEATVRGLRRGGGGVFQAVEITITGEPEEIEFTGVVRQMPRGGLGRWQIGEWKVLVTPETVIEGEPVVGAEVHVLARELGVGALVATSIDVVALPEPIETPDPTVAPTPETVVFDGVIQVLPPGAVRLGLWKIDGKWVTVTRDTEIVGEPAVRATAHVEANKRGPALIATRIEITAAPEPEPSETPTPRQVEFTETITRMATGRIGTWRIGDYKVLVTPVTEIIGEPAVGARAHVLGVALGGDRQVIATRIEILDAVAVSQLR